MQVARYLSTWWHCPAGASVPQYLAGSIHPLTDETRSHIAQGVAELVEAPDDVESAAKRAERAHAAVEKAKAAAAEATAAAEAAVEAHRIAEESAAAEAAAIAAPEMPPAA